MTSPATTPAAPATKIDPSKFVKSVMLENAKALDLKIDGKKPGPKTSAEALSKALDAHFKAALDKNPAAAVECDTCGALSTEDLDACPYCGDADEEEAATDNEEESDEEDDEEAEEAAPPAPSPTPAAPPAADAVIPEATAEVVGKTPEASTAIVPRKRGRPAKAEIVEVLPEGVTAEKLDFAVAQVKALKGESAASMWDLGHKIKELYDTNLWKARQTDGKPAYKNFNQFCVSELLMSHQNAYSLMDISANFTREDVAKFGTSKLGLLVQAPPEAQEKIKSMMTSGASKRDIQAEVVAEKQKAREEGKPTRSGGRAGASHKPGKGRKSEVITIASLTGSKTVTFFKKVAKGQPPVPAKSVEDTPIAALDLENGVRMTFQLIVDTAGNLGMKITTKRLEKLDAQPGLSKRGPEA